MKTVQLTSVATARVWFDERPTIGFRADGVLYGPARYGPTVKVGNFVGIEMLVGRGARAEYGLLGIQFSPDNLDRLLCEVPFLEGMGGPPWPDSLAIELDQVHLGLPREYANSIMTSLQMAVDRQIPSGVVRVVDCAHGLVGSSQHFFGRMASAAVTLLAGSAFQDEQIAKVLRQVVEK